jgi:serine O-acetyltransferase
MRFVFTASIPHTATIGHNSSFNNWGMGVVIHRRAVIGQNCEIAHHVTIGGRGGFEHVPIIGNDVFIGAGAKILGPITIGDGATIGANAVVLQDVPEHSVAAGIPARIIKRNVQSIVGPDPKAVVAL